MGANRIETFSKGDEPATIDRQLWRAGSCDRHFRALDAGAGRLIWRQRTSFGTTGVPSSYAVDRKQYDAVLFGWGADGERQQQSLRSLGTTAEQTWPHRKAVS